jgi:hypothetical protein
MTRRDWIRLLVVAAIIAAAIAIAHSPAGNWRL